MRTKDAWVAGSGISFFVVLLSVVVPHATLPARDLDGVDSLPSSEEIHQFFSDNYGMQQAQTLMHMIAAALFLVFAGALTATLRATPDSQRWARVALGAAVATTSVIIVAMGFVSALLERHQNVEGRTLLYFYHVGWSLHFKVSYLVPVFLGAVALASRRTGLMPSWLVWTTGVFAVATFLSVFGNLVQSAQFAQFPAFFLLMVWVLLVAIVAMVRGVGATATPAMPEAPIRPVRAPAARAPATRKRPSPRRATRR